jgi:heterodisulfide reductase subunit B
LGPHPFPGDRAAELKERLSDPQAAIVGNDMLVPCPSCYQRSKNAEVEIHASDAFRAEVNEMLDKPYTGRVTVWSLPEYLMKFVGEEKIASLVKTDLSQLKVVPYYGCLLGRPGELTGETDIEQPMMMDLLLQAAGAEAIVVACPLCHVNLDLKQGQVNKALGTDYNVPILYLSQVIGLALGLSAEDVQLSKNVVDPTPLVIGAIKKGAEIRAEEERKAAEKAAKEAAKAAKAAEAAAEPAAEPAAAKEAAPTPPDAEAQP